MWKPSTARASRFRFVPIFLAGLLLPVACQSQTKVQLRSVPPGAEVTLGHQQQLVLGQTDLKVTLDSDPRRSRVFRFRKAGYEDKELRRIVNGPEVTLTAHLARDHTSIRISTTPVSAVVRAFVERSPTADRMQIDWSGRGMTDQPSPNDDAFWGGKEEVVVAFEIEAPGYELIKVNRRLRRGSEVNLEYALRELKIELWVDSNVSGADVYERYLGYLGRTPLRHRLSMKQIVRASTRRDQKEQVEAQMNITLKKAGFVTAEVTEWIRLDQEVNRIDVEMEPEQ